MRTWLKFGTVACLAMFASTAIAADHTDSAGATAEPTADINDFYAFLDDGDNDVVFIVTVNPFATASSAFSDAVTYKVHTAATNAFSGDANVTTDIVCTFDDAQEVSCSVGGDLATVSGDASDPAGITSDGGDLQVFAGRRADPFFFHLAGFQAAVGAVNDAVAAGAMLNPNGCPIITDETAGIVADLLSSNAVNPFADADVLALTIKVDPSLLGIDGNNPVLSSWAATTTMIPDPAAE